MKFSEFLRKKEEEEKAFYEANREQYETEKQNTINHYYSQNNQNNTNQNISLWDTVNFIKDQFINGFQGGVTNTIGSVPQSLATGYQKGINQLNKEQSVMDNVLNNGKNVVKAMTSTDPTARLLYNLTIGRDDYINELMQNAQQIQENIDKADNPLGKVGAVLGGISSKATTDYNPVVQSLYNSGEYTGHLIGKENAEKTRDKLLEIDENLNKENDKWSEELAKESEKYDEVTKALGSGAQSIGAMTPSIALSAIGGGAGLSQGTAQALGLVQMGLSAKGSKTREGLKQGLDLETADRKGIASGSTEVGTEMMWGGLKAFNKFKKSGFEDTARQWIEKSVENKLKSSLGKKLTKKVGNWLLDVTGESIEEVASGIYNTWLDNATNDPNKQYTFEDLTNDTVGAIIATTGLNTLYSGVNKVSSTFNKTNTNTQNYKESVNTNTQNFEQSIKNGLNETLNAQINRESTNNASNKQIYDESARQYNIDTNNKTVQSLQQFGENRGLQLIYDASKFKNNNEQSIWVDDGDSRRVYINPSMNNETALQNLAVHEMFHDTIGSRPHDKLTNLIINKLQQGSDYKTNRQSVTEAYKEQLQGLNEQQANNLINEEMVSKYLGENLGNQEFVTEMVNSTERSTIEKVIDWIDNRIEQVKNIVKGDTEAEYWRKVRENIVKAYNSKYQGTEGQQYSIKTDKDIGKYWQVEESKDIFKNITDKKSLQKEAYNYLFNGNDNFEYITDTIDNKKIEFARISAKEYVYGRNNKKLQNNQYTEKLRTAPSIDDLIDNADIKYHSPLTHENKLFPNGFNNYQGKVGIDNDIFRYIVRVGKTANDGSLFYDVSLEPLKQKNKVDNKVLSTKNSTSLKSTLYNNSIADSETNVNTYKNSHQINSKDSVSLNNLNLDEVVENVKKVNGALSKQDYSDLNKLKKIKDLDKVTIYRASPVNELNNGDWVTTDKAYAQNVAKENGGKVYSYEVNVNELLYPNNVKDLPSLHRLSTFQYNNQNQKYQKNSSYDEYLKETSINKGKTDTIKDVMLPIKEQKKTTLPIDIQRHLDNEINTAIENKTSKGKVTLGKVTDKISNKIKSLLGINVENRIHILADNDIRHMLNEHGNQKVESKKGQIAITKEDIAKIPDIINNYDDIVKGNPNPKGDTIRYIKDFEDGTTYLVEVVPETSKTLNIKTMWKKPTRLANQQEPSLTSKTQSHSIPSTSNNSISQNNINMQVQNVNTKGKPVNWLEIERPTDDKKFRKHYKSIIESSNTTAEAKKIAKEIMGLDTYVPDSNKAQLQRADNTIATLGADKSLEGLKVKLFNNDRITPVDIAIGERLIEYYSKTGSRDNLQDAIESTALMGTQAGQTVQALAILNHQTPTGQVSWIQRSIDKANKELQDKYAKKNKETPQFEFTSEMQQKILNTETQEQMFKAIDEVYEELGKQVPKNHIEQLDEWRYFSMLANVKTHLRNMIGNVAMHGIQRTKDKIAGGIEDVVAKFNHNMERTHTLRKVSKEIKEFAKKDVKNMDTQTMLGMNENKYNPQSRLQGSRITFKSDIANKTLGKAFDLNSTALEVEDNIGLKAMYVKALGEYITANKIDINNMTDKQLAKARNYAVQSAKEATFHQASALATALNQMGRKNNIAKFALDAVVPFKKTPINVAKTGIQYSPVGLLKSAVYDIPKLRRGDITVNQYIDNVSRGLTGTGIVFVGYALAEAGILKASGEDDDKKEKYDEEQGKQNYSISNKPVKDFLKNFGLEIEDQTYSLDWLAPAGIPLFIGAEINQQFNQTKKEKNVEGNEENELLSKIIKGVENVSNGMANAMNPMSEMSMISGLTNVLSSYNKENAVGDMIVNTGKSYVNQYVPTLLGQVARTGDDYERTTKSTKTGVVEKAVDSTINQIKSKIPRIKTNITN